MPNKFEHIYIQADNASSCDDGNMGVVRRPAGMFQCSNVQLFKCSNVKIFKYDGNMGAVGVRRPAGMLTSNGRDTKGGTMGRGAKMQKCKNAKMQKYKLQNTRIQN